MDKIQRHTQREESGSGLWTQDASKEGQPMGQGLGLEQIPGGMEGPLPCKHFRHTSKVYEHSS